MPDEARQFPIIRFNSLRGVALLVEDLEEMPPTGQWPEFLWDLGCLGEVWIETKSPALTLSQRAQVYGFRVQGGMGCVRGVDFALRLLLEHFCAIQVERDHDEVSEYLTLSDDGRRPLIALRPDRNGNGRGGLLLRALLRVHGHSLGQRSRAKPWPNQVSGGEVTADRSALQQLESRCRGLDDGISLSDMAELCRLSALEPSRPRRLPETNIPDGAVFSVVLQGAATGA